jgi:hypothetical protein
MQPTIAINFDTRPPLRVRFTAISTNWVREFWDHAEAERFARTQRLNGKRATVEGDGLRLGAVA